MLPRGWHGPTHMGHDPAMHDLSRAVCLVAVLGQRHGWAALKVGHAITPLTMVGLFDIYGDLSYDRYQYLMNLRFYKSTHRSNKLRFRSICNARATLHAILIKN